MLESREQPDRIQALTTEEVLRIETEQLWGMEEAAAIWDGVDPGTTPIERYGRAMHRNGQAALCLSGGGIRSAAFAFGVVQALARKGLLAEFQYLSTVSGGGYLGGFLSRWIEERNGRVSEVEDALAGRGKPIAVEPSPVRWLRENSNFITPRIGIASADTWTAIAVSVRNVLINWLVFAPALLLAAMVPNLAAALLVVSDGFFADLCLVGGTLLVGFATFHAARDLPSHHRREHRRHHDGGYVLKRIVLPAALGPAALAAGVAHDLIGVGPDAIDHPLLGVWHFDWLTFLNGDQRIVQALTTAFSCLLAALIGGYAAAGIAASRVLDEELRWSNAKGFWQNAPVWVIGSAIASLFYVSGLALVPWVPCPLDVVACGRKVDALATLAVIFGILAQLALTILFVAFRWVARDQKLSPDLDREWLARLSAQKIRLGLAWTLFAATCLLSWHVVSWLMGDPRDFRGTWQWVVGAVGAASSLLAVFGGKTATTGFRADPGSARKLFTFDIIVGIATFVALVGLLILMGRAEFALAEALARPLSAAGRWSMVLGHLLAAGLIAAALLVTARFINVNRFSLNGMYRNRLARAFLGAARETRDDADPFTGFAPSDNIRLHALKAVNGATGRRVLMPVVNVALNLVGGPRLAWQERKAQAFVFTPLACGSAALAEDEATGRGKGRYIPSEIYAGSEPDLGLPGQGVSLATAVAISGAAASPSMGYHSSPPTAFLMTLFNVRLGAWLPNPGRDDLPGEDIKASAPKNALRELLGLTDARGRSVYLSDGGHFENLGLYEMVRRRCRFIVVSDAGCDPGATFADLGNALRKIKIDLGVDITIDTVDIASRAEWQREKSNFHALGTVHYSEGEGKLLYVKPSCHHDIPTDVRAYALASKTFPHESTADQWFSESQFESYRSLSSSLVDRLGAQGARGPERYGTGRLAAFFQKVEEQVAEAKKGRGREQVPGGLERPEPLKAADGTSEIKDAAPGPAERDGASRLSAPSSVHDRLTSADAGAGMTGMSAGT